MSGVPVESVEELDPEVRGALRRRLLGLADSKRLLGIRYSDWLLGAPSIETGIAASSMAQDEWGHARLLYAMLKDFGIDPMEVEHDRPAGAYASVDPLDETLPDWAAFTVAVVLVDGAFTVVLGSMSEGFYAPARARMPKMVTEEEFHSGLGSAWFRRLARGSEEARDRLRAAVHGMLPRTLAWLLPGDDGSECLSAAGLIGDESTLRSRYQAAVGPHLRQVEIEVSAAEPERSGWDAERGRGPGHPAEESVERARGDRNRALFVE